MLGGDPDMKEGEQHWPTSPLPLPPGKVSSEEEKCMFQAQWSPSNHRAQALFCRHTGHTYYLLERHCCLSHDLPSSPSQQEERKRPVLKLLMWRSCRPT